MQWAALFKGKIKITSGNRYTWITRGVLYVNPNRPHGHIQGGWPSIVHLLAHYAHQIKHPEERPHSDNELMLERDLTVYALKKGFHAGSLKRESKKSNPVNIIGIRAERINKRIDLWNSKKKRADNALKKLMKQKKYYDKKLTASSQK